MKIAYLIPDCGITGGVAVVCQHVNRLQKRGHEVYLISETLEKSIDWFPQQKVPVLTLKEYPDDVEILVATGWTTAFTVVDLPAKNKFYFVQSDETRFHEPDSIWQYLTALTYRLDFNYLTEARWIQNWLKENFGHDSAYIPNGINGEIFYPDKPLSPKGKRPRILLEGAIALPYKGMQDAFAAVEDLDAEIWCVSSFGKPEPGWRCDRFFNQVPMEQMRRIYSSCDILLKLSRVEGFFGPPLEMMACGGAVVVGKVTGYDEYIVDGHNALVVEPGDVASAKAAIERLIEDKDLRKKLIKHGYETAEAWQWEPSIDRLEAHFQNLITEDQNKSKSPVREMANHGISLSFKLAKKQPINYNAYEPSAFTEPVDKLLYRLRENKFVKMVSRIIYKVYKKMKQIKQRFF
ncbi:glycosyltransferase family 4 protein [Patescibacteria group bacterium]|nr:glycosyltransferase family 4 protein [Patescibacteria group bacterium]